MPSTDCCGPVAPASTSRPLLACPMIIQSATLSMWVIWWCLSASYFQELPPPTLSWKEARMMLRPTFTIMSTVLCLICWLSLLLSFLHWFTMWIMWVFLILLLINQYKSLAAAYKNKSATKQTSVDLACSTLGASLQQPPQLSEYRHIGTQQIPSADSQHCSCDQHLWQGAPDYPQEPKGKAFNRDSPSLGTYQEDVNRKATIVIEHLIQALDAAHTTQPYFRKCKLPTRQGDQWMALLLGILWQMYPSACQESQGLYLPSEDNGKTFCCWLLHFILFFLVTNWIESTINNIPWASRHFVDCGINRKINCNNECQTFFRTPWVLHDFVDKWSEPKICVRILVSRGFEVVNTVFRGILDLAWRDDAHSVPYTKRVLVLVLIWSI